MQYLDCGGQWAGTVGAENGTVCTWMLGEYPYYSSHSCSCCLSAGESAVQNYVGNTCICRASVVRFDILKPPSKQNINLY